MAKAIAGDAEAVSMAAWSLSGVKEATGTGKVTDKPGHERT